MAASLAFIVVIAALFVFVVLYGRKGPRGNWATRPIFRVRNGHWEFFPKPWDSAKGPEPKRPPVIWQSVVAGVVVVVTTGICIILIR